MALPAKRQPLAVMIAMHAKKPSGDDEAGSEPDGDEGERPEHSDEDLITACQDEIDAIKTGDAEALNKARISWMELYESKHGASGED